ncbi:MAG: alcohol dehydrogenase catalytic domain-containing protein [Acidobacteriota bacterium]
MSLPTTMTAAVYRGQGDVRIETVPVPELEPGEALVRVSACGVCGTDLKKVELGLVEPPRIFGHETAGKVVATGSGVGRVKEGDRVAIYHHLPDPESWYSQRKLFSQCERYLLTGATAGFAPAGGGYAEYVRVLPWIVEEGGLVPVPSSCSLEEATFVEPVNTCLKGVRMLDLSGDTTALVIGAGSIGLILAQLLRRDGAEVVVSDPLAARRQRAEQLGLATVDPTSDDVVETAKTRSSGRGADVSVVAATGAPAIRDGLACLRPGGTCLLFAQTRKGEEVAVDVGDLCVHEKRLIGSYSASIDVADEAARVVFDAEIDVRSLITHRLPLDRTPEAFELAARPADDTCKVVVTVRDEE